MRDKTYSNSEFGNVFFHLGGENEIMCVFRSARTSYRAFDFRPPVRPPATIFPEFIDELKHCRQASGTPQIVYFLKANDVSYPNLDENTNTNTEIKTNEGKT